MAKLTVHVLGVGVAAPGLPDWASAQAVLRGEVPYTPAATIVPAPQRLPATERRRAGVIIKVSINVADEALAQSGLTADLPTVFSASEGDGKNCHELCEALASSDRALSPTRFTNSVHNAAAGYWHIATHSMAASTSVCAFDASFAAGLMEAAMQASTGQQPVLLVVADQPYPQPLHGTRLLMDACGVALVLSGAPSPNAMATMTLSFEPDAPPTICTLEALEAVALALPAARGLALLERLALLPSKNRATDVVDSSTTDVVVRGFDDLAVRIQLQPVAPTA
jgi:hypothetical protein